jgi:hypothetical protein
MRRIARFTVRLIAVATCWAAMAPLVEAQGNPRRSGVESTPQADEPPVEDFDVPPDTPATLDGGATLNPLLLRPVRDDTLGLEYHDRPAYFYSLWLCQQIDSKSLGQLAAAFRAERQHANPKYARKKPGEFPIFVDVFQHPQDYRGRPVTLHGYLRKLIEYNPGPNDLSIEKVYEGWVYTDDSQSNPGVVVFTKKPPGLPLGGDITEEVQFTGYFLKMYGYDAQDTPRKAPMFLAGEVEWFPARAANARMTIPPLVYAALTAVALLAAWGIWQANRNRKSSLARYNAPGRNFDQFPPQEFLESDGRPVEPHH